MTSGIPAHLRPKAPADLLIVEDDPLAGDALRFLFEAAGYRVRLAANAAAAARACADGPVDLMLLDLTLPDGDGLSVMANIRAAGTMPRVTVALTGHDDAMLAEQCRQAGCVAVVIKPVPPRELLARAAQWVE
jgi:DNA-binding response OmpR family regulator